MSWKELSDCLAELAYLKQRTVLEPAERITKLENVLREIAKQKLSSELDDDQHLGADYQSAYNSIILMVRELKL